MNDPLSEVEILNLVGNVAKMAVHLKKQLIEEGLSEAEATSAMLAYLHGSGGGKFN